MSLLPLFVDVCGCCCRCSLVCPSFVADLLPRMRRGLAFVHADAQVRCPGRPNMVLSLLRLLLLVHISSGQAFDGAMYREAGTLISALQSETRSDG